MSLCRAEALSVILAGVLLQAIILGACATNRNEIYCDEQIQCVGAGLFCDIDGIYELPNSCIAPPAEGACNRATVCEVQPFCSSDSDGTCVECLINSDCKSAGGVCESGHCRSCVANTECDSQVCEADACLRTDTIVYVATDGADDPNCGVIDNPCLSIAFSILHTSPTRNTLLLRDGVYTKPIVVSRDIRIYGFNDVTLAPNLAANDAIGIDVLSEVTLSNLTIAPINAADGDWGMRVGTWN